MHWIASGLSCRCIAFSTHGYPLFNVPECAVEISLRVAEERWHMDELTFLMVPIVCFGLATVVAIVVTPCGDGPQDPD